MTSDAERWTRARLIPTSGITGQDEAERRATSAVLAVLGSVREFGRAVLRPLGAPAGQLDTYIETPFKLGDRTVIPDGLVRASRGSKSWTALIEVKTGNAELTKEQVENYLDVAREQGFDAVLTISNQIAPTRGMHPVAVDKRKLKKVALYHLSWAVLLTIAVQHRVNSGVEDPDQAWILGELIRYLEHPKSGALDFSDMGAAWTGVRGSVAAGTLRQTDKGLTEILERWDQLLRFTALRLGRELGANVQVALSRKDLADPAGRANAHAKSLVTDGVLTGSIRIPDAVAPIDITADIRGARIIVSTDLAAPREGRPATRVNWLVRQLTEASGSLRIDAWAANSRTSTSELLSVVRENPAVLISDPKKELRTFRIAAVSQMGAKRTAGRGGFIDSVLNGVETFYGQVLQEVRPWSAKPPKLPKGPASIPEATDPDPLDTSPSDTVERTTTEMSELTATTDPWPDDH